MQNYKEPTVSDNTKRSERLRRTVKFLLPSDTVNRSDKWNVCFVVYSCVLALLAVLSVGIVIRYIAGPMEGYLHSDYTDTIYWAQASFESGTVFNPDFKYAALLPFSANLWFIPLIAVFGVTMKAHVIGMIIFLLLFVGAIYFMCRSFDWSIPWTAVSVIAMVLLLSGSNKLREIMWGHVIYYSLALLLVFFGVGFIARIDKLNFGKNIKTVLAFIGIAVFFAGVATDGFQIIALVTLPCLGALFMEYICDGSNKLLSSKAVKIYSICGVILVATLVGLKLLDVFKGNLTADYANTYSNLAPIDQWMDNLLGFPKKYFSLMGVTHTGSTPIFEIDTIMILIRMVAAIACLILPVILLFNYKKISDKGIRLILWMHIIVSAATMFGFVCGYLSGGSTTNWRITTMAGTGVMASVATVKFFMERARAAKELVGARVMALVMSVMMLGSAVNFKTMADMPMDYGRDNILHQLTEVLEENDLEYGYATFWRSQAITLLSDSRVKTRMILVGDFKGVYTDFYQSCYSWYEDVPGVDRYFVLLTEAEDDAAYVNIEWYEFKKENKHEIIQYKDYVIYIFDRNINIEIPQ